MEWLTTILKLVFELLKYWIERSKEKKVERKEALDVVMQGLKEKDKSKVTVGFSRLNRI
jgi:hypothetical protein